MVTCERVCTQLCVGVVIVTFISVLVLISGGLWFDLLHSEQEYHLGWVGLYGTLTTLVASCLVGLCARCFGWGRVRQQVLPT